MDWNAFGWMWVWWTDSTLSLGTEGWGCRNPAHFSSVDKEWRMSFAQRAWPEYYMVQCKRGLNDIIIDGALFQFHGVWICSPGKQLRKHSTPISRVSDYGCRHAPELSGVLIPIQPLDRGAARGSQRQNSACSEITALIPELLSFVFDSFIKFFSFVHLFIEQIEQLLCGWLQTGDGNAMMNPTVLVPAFHSCQRKILNKQIHSC